MNTIKIEDHEFNWKLVKHCTGEYGWASTHTHFYHGVKEVKHRKYWLFGPVKITQEPVCVFYVNFDITAQEVSNTEINQAILQEYHRWKDSAERKKALEEGKYVVKVS